MTKTEFIAGLVALGYQPMEHPNNFVIFDYEILVGRFAGQRIKLGLQVFDINPPPGPHVNPPLLPRPTQNSLAHPLGGIHASPLGEAWQYWSRPYSTRSQTDRSARAYMTHITRLFDFP